MHPYKNKTKAAVKYKDSYRKKYFVHNIIRCDYFIKDNTIKNKIFHYIEEEENSINLDRNNILTKDDLNKLYKSLINLINKVNNNEKNNNENKSISPYVDVFRKGDNALLSIRLESTHPSREKVI